MTRVRTPLLVLAVEAALVVGVLAHARVRENQRQSELPAILALSRFLPAADLSLAGAARHLRFPSLEEPSAAFTDAPVSPDLDPAGGALAPPTDVYAASADQQANRRPLRPLGHAVDK